MALVPIQNYHVRADQETGQLLICHGDMMNDFTVIGPAVRNVIIQDETGRHALVTVDKSLNVKQAELPEWFGLPQYGFDAAAEVDDDYYDLFVTTKECTNASLYVETNDAIISFGGRITHFFLDKDAGQVLLTGLDIPIGSTISGRNAVVASDYTNLRIAVW